MVISTEHISLEDELADLCREPRCENDGLFHSCPPHVSGPSGLRKLLKNYKYAIVIQIDIPLNVLLPTKRRDIMKLLHEIVPMWNRPQLKPDISIQNLLPAVPAKESFAMTLQTAVCWQRMESVGILDMLGRPCPVLELTNPN